MKANELMLSDWVRVINAGPCQVVQVDQYDIQTTYGRQRINEQRLEAITLTKEILLANGFKKEPDITEDVFEYVYSGNGKRIYVTVLPWDSFAITASGECRIELSINHVHELQHVLRMMRLNDLADNFKIA